MFTYSHVIVDDELIFVDDIDAFESLLPIEFASFNHIDVFPNYECTVNEMSQFVCAPAILNDIRLSRYYDELNNAIMSMNRANVSSYVRRAFDDEYFDVFMTSSIINYVHRDVIDQLMNLSYDVHNDTDNALIDLIVNVIMHFVDVVKLMNANVA